MIINLHELKIIKEKNFVFFYYSINKKEIWHENTFFIIKAYIRLKQKKIKILIRIINIQKQPYIDWNWNFFFYNQQHYCYYSILVIKSDDKQTAVNKIILLE
jgi:hypothetical protein